MVLLLVCALWIAPPSLWPQREASLKSWADGPVSIVLSDAERKTFAQLSNDEERQHFIDAFWKSRDEGKAEGATSFKEEFQKRLENADTLFGGDAGLEGWRTERGRFYILLGPPASRAQFKSYGQLRPLELWFYSNKKDYPQLPSFFYLMFYQRDEIGDYRQYSPFIDQPRNLVRGIVRNNKDAYRVLSNINLELAHASMSLLPGEPIDNQDFMPSMTSDAVLAQIHQIPKTDYERAGLLREIVKVKLKYGGTTSMTLYPFQIANDAFTVDVAVDRPDGIDDAKVETVVLQDGKEQGRTRASFAKDEPLVGRLVLKPGEYTIEATVTDPAGKQSFIAHDNLHLKAATGLTISDVLFFHSAAPEKSDWLGVPFAYRGYRFKAEPEKQFRPADKFQVLFQIAVPQGAATEGKVSVDYTIAGLNNAASRWTYHDDIAKDRFDSDGLLLNSKTLPIRDVPPGRYFLVILVKDSAGHRVSQTVSFEVM